MARPFDETLPYQQISSSISSQTTLPAGRAWRSQTDGASYPSSIPYEYAGQAGSAPRLTKDLNKTSRTRLPKIKSSPSHGALAAARQSHARLHKRGNSTTSTANSPTSPTYVPDYLLKTSSPSVPASAHAELHTGAEPRSTSKSKGKIRPLLQRKFTSQEKVTIDLSRSAAENEGLDAYTSSEITGATSGGRGFHHRTTSAASQLSTATSSSNRYGAQYVHPMRQTPRPYTPPVANSYKTSFESEAATTDNSAEARILGSHTQQASAPTSFASLPSSRRPPPLQVGSGSASRLNNSSQINLPGTPSSLRFNTDAVTSSDIASPTTRSSIESSFRKTRSRSNTANTANDPIDPAVVQAARKEFREREAAKELKIQQAEMRAQEKEARRQEKREESERRTSEKRERNRARSNAASEKSSFLAAGEQYDGFPVTQLHSQGTMPKQQPQRKGGNTTGSTGEPAHSSWTLFWFRFRTMWLKLKRKFSK